MYNVQSKCNFYVKRVNKDAGDLNKTKKECRSPRIDFSGQRKLLRIIRYKQSAATAEITNSFRAATG